MTEQEKKYWFGKFFDRICYSKIKNIGASGSPLFADRPNQEIWVVNDTSYVPKNICFNDWWTTSPSSAELKARYSSPIQNCFLIEKENKFYPIINPSIKMTDEELQKAMLKSFKAQKAHKQNKISDKELVNHTDRQLRGLGKLNLQKPTRKAKVHFSKMIGGGTERVVKDRTVGTGVYTLGQKYMNSNIYELKEETRTEKVVEYKTREGQKVENTALQVEQYFYFSPISEAERQNFQKIIENQRIMRKYFEELPYLGVFNGKRKKEIFENTKKMLRFSYLVIFKALLDRQRDFAKEVFDEEDSYIQKIKKNIAQNEAELERADKSAFKKRAECKKYIKVANQTIASTEKHLMSRIRPQCKKLELMAQEIETELKEISFE